MSFITFFFLALMPYSSSITFNFTSFTSNNINDDMVLLENANYDQSFEAITLIDTNTNATTTSSGSWQYGRATYFKPLRLWDKDSNDLASFTTSFTFNIVATEGSSNDGLTFFLAQDNLIMYGGGSIGLPFDNVGNTGLHPFVAVEFDTHVNENCDPLDPGTNTYMGNHVGIDINSTTSVVYGKWQGDLSNRGDARASVEYDSSSSRLSVYFTSTTQESSVTRKSKVELHCTIDLRRVLPEWVIFGFSAAAESGAYQMSRVRSWGFDSTELKAINAPPTLNPNVKNPTNGTQISNLPPPTPNQSVENQTNTTQNISPPTQNISPPTTMNHNAKSKNALVVGLIVGLLAVVTVLSILIYLCWRRKKYTYNGDTLVELPGTRFSYEELATSTEKFAGTKKLALDGSGAFYKGFLKGLNKHVAVKRVYSTSIDDFKQYSSEVKIISKPTHPNLVPLVGWCHEEQELLLLYEFFEKGSLDLHLFRRDNLLTWNTRYIAARDLASALICLHGQWETCVLHRDIKSSNVMLDSNLKVKLGDYGFAKLVNRENNMIAGTVGYVAPEYLATRKATKESDVFSFGVVALEIASGRSAINIDEHGETNLVKWVWDHYATGKLLEAADPRLELKVQEEEEMACLMTVGLWCAQPDPKLRPSIKRASQVLNREESLPQLPTNMPV